VIEFLHICNLMKVEVKKSKIPNAGKGLFAADVFKRGEPIIEYTGEQITWAQCQKRNEALDGVGAYYFYISERKCIDALYRLDSLARYANDAAGFIRIPGIRNNARFEIIKGKPFIVASRTIMPGDEIYVSYGREYWAAMRHNGFDPNKKKPKKSNKLSKTIEKQPVPRREAKH
jgi:uncharacterized protein